MCFNSKMNRNIVTNGDIKSTPDGPRDIRVFILAVLRIEPPGWNDQVKPPVSLFEVLGLTDLLDSTFDALLECLSLSAVQMTDFT